jgi:putative membrane-bound dehydrogenase-like protein
MSRFFSVFASLVFASLSFADDFPKPYDSEKNPGKPMPAEEAAAKFKMPPGFKVTVFASEPDVRNPIGCSWDGKGRLWIAENYTYAERPMNFDLSLSDRVVVFHDKDGDGKPDERVVFLDNLKRLTSVCVGRGGVWLMCPPQLLFVPDKDNDCKPDGPAQVVLEGFDVPKENYHNFANGLKWGPDGWLYGRCGASCPGNVRCADKGPETAVPLAGGIWRYHPEMKIFEPLCHGTTNPWGHDWDENGECFFVNSVNGHLWHMIPGAHFRRPHTISPNPYVYEPMEMIADHWHFDLGKGWNQKAVNDSRNVDATIDKLGGGHAHSGCMIYNGDNWPKEYRGKLMMLNLHGRRINVERLERYKSGFVAKREPDIFFAADPFFRGIDLTYGPDGAVYVLDWSDTGECHENSGVHRNSGRIYRIAYGETKAQSVNVFADSNLSRVNNLSNRPNHWFRKMTYAFPDVQREMLNSISRLERAEFQSGIKTTPINSGPLALDTPKGNVRDEIVKRTFSNWTEDCRTIRDSKSVENRLLATSALQRCDVSMRSELSSALLAHPEDADDPNIPFLIWYGLIPVAEQLPEQLPKLAAEGKIPKVREWITRRLAEMYATKPWPLDELLRLTATSPEADRKDVLVGMKAGFAGSAKAAMPAAWKQFNKEFKDASLVSTAKALDVLFGDGRALDDVRKIALDNDADLNQRKAALSALISANPPDLRKVCEQLVKVRFLNVVAVKGLTTFNDIEVGKVIANQYGSFHPSERSHAVEALVSRPVFAAELLDAIGKGRIARGDVSASQARQIRGYNDTALTQKLNAVWGEFRDSPKDKQEFMAKWKADFLGEGLKAADASAGKVLFTKHCASCHKLFGNGGEIGPDLTGAGRHDLDYLLGNIVDPSAVVTKDFQMTAFTLADGRTVNGIATVETDRVVTVQTATEKVTIAKSDIENRKASTLSLMPDGLIQPLSPKETRDLFKYLQATSQVP